MKQDRAVSSVLSYALSLLLTTVLITILLTVSMGYVQGQTTSSEENQARGVAINLATTIEHVDEMADSENTTLKSYSYDNSSPVLSGSDIKLTITGGPNMYDITVETSSGIMYTESIEVENITVEQQTFYGINYKAEYSSDTNSLVISNG